MISKKSVSIVTVSYQAVSTINKTIQSVFDQSYHEYEYIIVDGNSTDGTLDIIKKYEKEFVHKGIRLFYISEPDKGIYDAMNKALLYCNNEWIIFLNADDYFFNENVLYDVFEEPIDENIIGIYGTTYMRKSGDIYFKKNYPMKVFSYRLPFIHQALFVRRNILLKYRFDTQYNIAADVNQWMHMYVDGLEFKQINIPIVYFSMEGISHRNFPEYKREMYDMWNKYGLIKKKRITRFVKMNIVPYLKRNNILWKLYIKLHSI